MSIRIAGRSAATAATANHAVAAIWNPSSSLRIRVTELSFVAQGAAPTAGNSLQVRRITARGTAGSTLTPTIANDTDRIVAPVSGVVVDLAAYTVQPTLDTGVAMWQWNLAAVIGSGVVLPFEVTIPPGAGLAIAQIAATVTPALDVSCCVTEI